MSDPADGVSSDGAQSLAGVISGIVAVVGALVVEVPSADGVALLIRVVEPSPEKMESLRSGKEVDSDGKVTESEIDTSDSALRPGIVRLLVLVKLVIIVVLGAVMSGTVEAGLNRVSPFC